MTVLRGLFEFLDIPSGASWELTPEEALDFLKAKGLKASFDYRDLIGEEHARAFTVAKMMDTDLLADVKASLDEALANGVPFKEWSDTIIPTLQAKGWWGRKQVTDPLTGETIVAGLGSPSRLTTIYRTNMQSAYAAGAWDAIKANADTAPYLLYDAIDDLRTRPEHHAWDNTVLPVTDPWWNSHYPPNGWNCRCSVIQLSEDELADLGLAPTPQAPDDGSYKWTNPRTHKAQRIPNGLDPGWNQNVGKARQKLLAEAAAQKIAAYDAEMAKAAAKGLAAAVKAGEAAELAAHAAITKAIEQKTPFLHKAIEQVKATKAGKSMTATELHQAALAKAAKTEQDVGLYQWKTAKAAGKTPSPKAQAIFDKLPEEQKLELQAQVEAIQGAQAAEAAQAAAAQAAQAAKEAAEAAAKEAAALKAAEDAAKAKLEAFKGGTLVEKAAAQKFGLPPNVPATEILAKVEAEIASVKASQAAAGIKSATKKSLVEGKIPSPAQMKYLGSLSPEDLAKLHAEVDKAKAAKLGKLDPVTGLAPDQQLDEAAFQKWEAQQAAAQQAGTPPPAPPPTMDSLDTSKFVQVGPQKGSNPGGLFQDPATGEQWYIKTPASLDHARNEVLASKLYTLAGAQVPELRLTTLNGQPAVASRIIEGLQKGTGPALAKAAGAKDFFAVDAWLGNWDVGGASLDNLLLKGGQAYRVDVGGSLRYRAQGGLKGAAWSDTVAELDTLRNASTNPQTAKVFGKMTQAEMKASAERLLRLDPDDIDDLVDLYGPLDAGERTAMKATLRARIDDIARQLKIDPKAPPAPPAPELTKGGKHVTADDFKRIREARANGYTISTDGGQIEDHQVLLMHYTDAAGKPKTRLVAKLRGEGATKVEELASKTATGAVDEALDLSEVSAAIESLGKSINSRVAKGTLWDSTVDLRLSSFDVAANRALKALNAAKYDAHGAAAKAQIQSIQQTVAAWSKANGGLGKKMVAIEQLPAAKLRQLRPMKVKAKPEAPKPGAITWKVENGFSYRTGTSVKGALKESGGHSSVPGVGRAYEGWTATSDARIRFIPDTGSNSITSRGLLHIEVDGDTLQAAELAVSKLEALGITTTRTTQGERLGLYLDKLAYIRTLRDKALATQYAALDKVADEGARNAAKLALLNKHVGYDMTKSPHWNPEGVHQAFGHGRTLQMRPDLDGPKMAAFESNYRVYTNVTGLGSSANSNQWSRLLQAVDGGGMLSSQMERARRGLASGGTSVSSDHMSGGANYIFTRIRAKSAKSAGVYWKPSVLRRVDAFSYDGDLFGNVSRSTQEGHRAIDVDGFIRNAGNGSNETIFRDGISLFDDLDRIIFSSADEAKRAVADMRARGYTTWPDGRRLEDVLLGPQR